MASFLRKQSVHRWQMGDFKPPDAAVRRIYEAMAAVCSDFNALQPAVMDRIVEEVLPLDLGYLREFLLPGDARKVRPEETESRLFWRRQMLEPSRWWQSHLTHSPLFPSGVLGESKLEVAAATWSAASHA